MGFGREAWVGLSVAGSSLFPNREAVELEVSLCGDLCFLGELLAIGASPFFVESCESMAEMSGVSNAVTKEDTGGFWPNLGGALGLTGAVTKLCALLP